MIVVTLSKAPNSLRGDLTKWYQEIQTGVYVGNVSARIRDLLWQRIVENIGYGEASMAYNINNELGYEFRTTRKDRAVILLDGLPFMKHLNDAPVPIKHGFSNAAKFHRAKNFAFLSSKKQALTATPELAVLDIETTGLNAERNEIISIGVVKWQAPNEPQHFYKLIKPRGMVPAEITEMTQLTIEELNLQGIDLTLALRDMQKFIGNSVVVGYNLSFDMKFITAKLRKIGQQDLNNRMLDLLPVVKKRQKFLDNYRLGTVLEIYGIQNKTAHNALSDEKATLELARQLIKNGDLRF